MNADSFRLNGRSAMARSRLHRVHRAARSAVRAAVRETASEVYRETILGAAESEFIDRGYAAARMVDVARRAGMSVGALYRHFDSKEAIFVSLAERAAGAVLDRMRRTTEAVDAPRARIAGLIETMLGFIEENRGMFLTFHQLGDADRAACRALVERSESTRNALFAIYRDALADGVARGDFRDDVAVDDQLAFVTGAVHGFLEQWAAAGGRGGLVEKSPVIAQLTLTALGGSS
jgi:AcrR family transcriptional regulator